MAYDLRETKQVLRVVLMRSTTVQGLVADGVQVFTAHGRDADEATRKQPALILDFRGGPGKRLSAAIQNRTVHLYAYSNVSQDQADELHVLATAVLTDVGAVCHPDRATNPACPQQRVAVLEAAGATSGWNDQVGAWYARSTLAAWGIG